VPRKRNIAEDPTQLRSRAEDRLRAQQEPQGSKARHQQSEADTQRLLHELEVHQIELEMQIEELSEARDKMEGLLEKYTDLYDFAPTGYLTFSPAGAIIEANLAASNLLEVARSSLVKRRFGSFLSATDLRVFSDFLQQAFASKARQSCEVTLNVAGRPPRALDLKGIVFESGQACRVTLTDITDRKQAEGDRLILNKLESTGILAGGIAHDFNNLLTVNLLNLELAQMLNLPNAELAQYLTDAKKSALMSKSLTAQLLTFAEGGAPIRKAMKISGLIQESVRIALSGSKVRGEFSLAEDLWPADVDEAQLGQVIRSMVLNAREAMPNGGVVSVRAENVVLSGTEQPPLPAGDYVQVSIADQGIGIPKDVLPKIFDPYFSTKQRGDRKGMGLGLTICHSIVHKHEGAITVESAVRVGTTFDIYLPAILKIAEEEKMPPPCSALQHGRVLVMDDEAGVREIVGLTLSEMGHTVELAEDGQAVIEVYKTAKLQGRGFDVVILDLTVREGMGGRETLQELLKLDPRVKAIAMSGYALDPVILEPERHGFKGVLTKPFDMGKLHKNLDQVMYNSKVSKTAP
jgi:signal transduction histidine kinase/ActR/RegA family two-component response regulator